MRYQAIAYQSLYVYFCQVVGSMHSFELTTSLPTITALLLKYILAILRRE